MRSTRAQLLAYTLLLIAAACSPSPPSQPKVVQYNLQTNCSGGGGRHTCVSKNLTEDKLGPFDLEIEFLDDRGISIGKTLIRNDNGIEPKGEWNFDVTGPANTRSLRFGRVTPRG